MHAVLRRIGLLVFALTLALFAFVRLQQYVLRHRGERLHAEILALQLHPGTFADIQQLQREWGRFGHYDGDCTPHHCIYQITVSDVASALEPGVRLASWNLPPKLMRLYRILGGRPTIVTADVHVRNNRMWVASFGLGLWAYPGTGRNHGYPYMVLAGVDSGSRLLPERNAFGHNPRVLKQGFWTDHELSCGGCEVVYARVTPQTPPDEIRSFNKMNLDCITRLKTCRDPVDVAPSLWSAAIQDLASKRADDQDQEYCSISTPILAREANDILLVNVVSRSKHRVTDRPEQGTTATVKVLESLKNGSQTPPDTLMHFLLLPSALRSQDPLKIGLVPGQKYLFLYNNPQPGQLEDFNAVFPCHALPDTPGNVSEIRAGIALDPSAGEPYNQLY